VDYQIATYRATWEEEEGYRSDFLRMAVVILHSTTESILREVVRVRVKAGNGVTLDKLWQESKAPKIYPSEITKYRYRNAQEIIDKLVDEWLEQSRYSDVGEIYEALELIGLPKDKFDVDFDLIKLLLKKRHLVAHRGDRHDPTLGDYGVLRTIQLDRVIQWRDAVQELLESLLDKLIEKPVVRVIPRKMDPYVATVARQTEN
jgi:hypothetical protein